MRALFAELRRCLTDDGTLWLNIGDSYVSKPPGNVRGVSDRSGLNGAQTSDKYRETLTRGMGTKRDTTGMGLPEKNLLGIPWRVAFALQDDGWILRNAIIWNKPNAMPESVTDRLSGRYEHVFMFSKSRRYWFDLDPIREPVTEYDGLSGSGTTGLAAQRTGRRYIGIDLSREYLDLSLRTRLNQSTIDFEEPA
jgi:site-specific DNA-methyltransferase (cytosine-N4-specific)